MSASFSNLAIRFAVLLQSLSKSILTSTSITCLVLIPKSVLTSASFIPSEIPLRPYCIHTTRFLAQHLDHGSQEECRRCSCSLDRPPFHSKTCSRTDVCFISAYQAHSRICQAHLGQVHRPQLVRRSRDRFGRVGPLCSGYSPACQAD